MARLATAPPPFGPPLRRQPGTAVHRGADPTAAPRHLRAVGLRPPDRRSAATANRVTPSPPGSPLRRLPAPALRFAPPLHFFGGAMGVFTTRSFLSSIRVSQSKAIPGAIAINWILKVEEAETIVKLTEELDSIDTGLLQEASKIIKALNKALDNFEMTQRLGARTVVKKSNRSTR